METEQIQLIMMAGTLYEKPVEDRQALYTFLDNNILPEQIYVVDDKTPYVVYRNMHFYGLEVIKEFIWRYKYEYVT